MNIKKQVVENITKKLTKQQNDLKYKRKQNAWKIKRLAEESEVSKREIAALGVLIKSLS